MNVLQLIEFMDSMMNVKKITNINNFENNEFSLDNIINKKIEDWIKSKI